MSICRVAVAGMLAFAAVLPRATESANAQQIPQRPIRFVVPFGPGGYPDRVARLIANEMAEQHPVFIENKPGASGMVGSAEAAKAAPDGLTIVLTTISSLVFAPLVNPRADFRPIENFTHFAYIGGPPMIVVAPSAGPIRTFDDLIRLSKEKPLSYGTGGTGSIAHLGMAYVAHQSNLQFTQVPYPGPMTGDILSGVLDFAALGASTVAGNIDAGTMRALAIGTTRRLERWPQVPTFKELGYNINPISWMTVSGPAGMTPELQTTFNTMIVQILARPKLKEALEQEMIEPIVMSPTEVTNLYKSEIATWAPLVKTIGLGK